MNKSFRAHGSFTFRVEGRIIVSDVTGPWNKELVEQWATDVFPAAKQVAAMGPNVGIAVMHESMLCPSDALASLKLTAQYGAKKLNCVAHLIVAHPQVAGRDLLQTTFARIYDGIINHRMFDNLEDAMKYAQHLIAEADKTF